MFYVHTCFHITLGTRQNLKRPRSSEPSMPSTTLPSALPPATSIIHHPTIDPIHTITPSRQAANTAITTLSSYGVHLTQSQKDALTTFIHDLITFTIRV